MKKAIGIIILGLLLSGNAYAANMYKVTTYIRGPDYIIFTKATFYTLKINKQKNNNSWNKMWSESKTHCRKYSKEVYVLIDNEMKWDSDFSGLNSKWRFMCGKDEHDAVASWQPKVKAFKSRLGTITHYSQGGSVIKIPKKYVKKKAEPKKKTPKQNPDDNKVVAASMGSGFFVTRAGHLVTNYHVIEECNAVKTNILGKEVRTDIIAVDKTNDLAIIKAEMNPSKVFPVSNKDVSLLQDVIVAGFPLGKSVSAIIKTHKGSVTALAGFGDNYSNFQTDATINQGNSGGPIMDQKGNVVGVAVQLIAAEQAQNVFFGIKSSTLKTFANANSINFLPPNNREMSNEDLGQLITEATVFLECWMTVAKIKQIIAQEENRKAFYSKHK
jgi:S1-C subfamily serine protease